MAEGHGGLAPGRRWRNFAVQVLAATLVEKEANKIEELGWKERDKNDWTIGRRVVVCT